MVGTVLGGRYELLELIGTGGMACVYKARCRTLNRFVAIKILKDEYKDDRDFVKKFYVESQSAASLSNVNIVSIYDVGEEAGMNYIVMELVEGVTLKDVINKNRVLSWKVALNCGLQILNALECAHKNGIVHRDIKPQNIIATYDGILKVADFGIAKAVNGNETKKIDKSVIGSVHYISPEQAKGIMIDARSDIYSLGIVMYEMLTGKLPFDGENPVSVALMHLNSEPEFIKDINISVPLELANIVHKAMSRDIARRYQSAREMINDLTEFRKKEMLSAPDLEEESKSDTRIIFKDSSLEKETKNSSEENKKFATVNNNKEEKQVIPRETVSKEIKKEEIEIKEKKTKKPKTKEEKVAIYSAIGVSAVVIVIMFYVFMNMFFPNFGISNIFKTKEYYLEDYIGRNIDEVVKELEEAGFKVETQEGYSEDFENDEIIAQRPSGEMNVKVKTTTVQLTVNVIDEENVGLISVPSVLNDEAGKAKSELEELGFRVDLREEESENIPENHVIKQQPEAGSKLKEGETVTIYVSKAKEEEPVKVPNFVGMTRENAKKKATELGIMVTFSESDEGEENAEKVVSQSKAKDSEVEKGSTVNLVVGRKQAATQTQPETPPEEKTVTKNFNIPLLTDVNSEVVVKKDNKEIYKKTHKPEEKSVSVSVSGSGTHHIIITVNGQQYLSQDVKFN